LGAAYEIPKDTVVYPSVSCNPGEIVELHIDATDMTYMPKEFTAVGDILATEYVRFGVDNEVEEKP